MLCFPFLFFNDLPRDLLMIIDVQGIAAVLNKMAIPLESSGCAESKHLDDVVQKRFHSQSVVAQRDYDWAYFPEIPASTPI